MESGLIITNIKSGVDEKTIRSYFEKFGKINYFNLVTDKFINSNKVCYVDYASVDSARCAFQDSDKATIFGCELRVSYKKIIPSTHMLNGNTSSSVPRAQSFGRGRGMPTDSFKPHTIPTPVILHNFNIPTNTKIFVEIVDLRKLSDILARPLKQTEHSKHNLTEILLLINEETNVLSDVRIPEINGYYLAKWEEDNNFYRAKLLEKLGNNKFKVCFVDEGTSGDIVTELKEIPKEMTEIPCQFVPCDLGCEELEDLIKLIVTSGESLEVAIYVTSPELNSGKYRINLFTGDNDVVDLYKKNFNKDPRRTRLPNESDLIKHEIGSEFTNFLIPNIPKQRKDVFPIVLADQLEMNPKVDSLEYSPLSGDLVLYRQSDKCFRRSVIENIKFSNNKIVYQIRFVDENRCLETSMESLFTTKDKCLFVAPRMLNCVLDSRSDLPDINDVDNRIVIKNYDCNKNLYVVSIIKPEPISRQLIGNTFHVFVTHVESCMEFFIQFADDKSVKDSTLLQELLNENYQAPKLSIRDLSVNQMIVAPYLGEYYRASVREIDIIKSMVRVFFIDYGNSEWVKSVEILRAVDKIARSEPLAFKCKLAVMIKPICLKQTDDLFRDYCGQGDVKLSMKVLKEDNDQLSVDLVAENKSGFLDILQFKKFVSEPNVSMNSNDIDRNNLLLVIEKLEARVSHLENLMKNRYSK